jgi:hypothetical protein
VYSVKGIKLNDLLAYLVGNGVYAENVSFAASDGFNSNTYQKSDFADVMLLWEAVQSGQSVNTVAAGTIRSAKKDGTTGRDWVGNVVTMNVTLGEVPGGANPPGGGENPPSYDFAVYTKSGTNGTPTLAKGFTKNELRNLASNNVKYAYLYIRNDIWNAIVATELVPLDSLLNAAGAGAQWRSGSYLEFTCTDGVYDKSYPYYENIRECAYYFSSGGTQTTVPAGFALSWNSGSADNIDSLAGSAYDSGHPRFVYGVSKKQYDEKTAAGARSPSGVVSVTIVYGASSVPSGSVGTEHPATDATETSPGEEAAPAATTSEPGVPVAATITVRTVTEADKQEVIAAFSDVSDSWYTESVAFAVKNELFKGVSDTEFAPTATMTRAMLITVLARAAGVDTSGGEAWYSSAVDWAKGLNISDGAALNDSVTREQIATMLYRFAGQPSVIGASDSADASDISSWARSAMLWAQQQGIITGYGDGTVKPGSTATRAEVATMIQRWLEKQ